MRKEPFTVGNIVHVYNRGNRKQEIVRDSQDRWRFIQSLFYFNDEYSPLNLFRTLDELQTPDSHGKIIWPAEWPPRRPLVKILAFALMDNHFHLILEEIQEGGITKFMRKLGTGMTNRFNTRYKESGKLFQGSYRARRVDDDNYLKYLSVYIHVKNIFQLYPGGFDKAISEFEKAFEFAKQYPLSSLASYLGGGESKIIDSNNLIYELTSDENEFKKFSHDCLAKINFDERKLSIL